MPVPTLIDVGKACGLSKATVSLALRGHGRIPLKTRKRVQKAAEALGYRPNAAAAVLSAARHKQPVQHCEIAVITATPFNSFHPSDFYGLMDAVKNRGYAVRRVEMSTVPNIPKAIAHLHFEGVDGVILDRIWVPDLDLFQYDWSAFSVTVHRRTRYLRGGYDVVTPDAVQSLRRVWQEVRSRGYTRIGVLLCRHQPMMSDDELREGALAFCHSEAGASETILAPYLGDLRDERAIVAWVERHQPDAVIGFNNWHYQMLRDHFDIPQKMGYASLHGIQEEHSDIARMFEYNAVVAAMTVDHLDQLIRHSQLGKRAHPRQILVENGWQPGATLPEKTG